MSDTDKDNALSEMEFCIAMKLVLMRRKGYDIPTSLPDSLAQQQRQEPSELLTDTSALPTNSKIACLFSEAVEKQLAPPVKSDRRGEAKPATQTEQPEPSRSDISGHVPTKREDTVDEILVEIGNQDTSDTGNSLNLKCNAIVCVWGGGGGG